MKLSLIDILLSDGAARAVCWTLVHSLWEGLLAALLAGLIILATRRRSAALRYNLLAADLLLFILIAGATFAYETGQDGNLTAPNGAFAVNNGPTGAIGDNAIPPTNVPGHLKAAPGIPATDHLLQRASDYLNTHAVVVTLVWLACLTAQMLRLTLGLYQVRRLRRSNTIPPQPYWNERLSILARRLGIKRTVTLLQSALVKAPSALGFLKPSILVPMGMLANLPPDQVETILLHELAHIRRGDYAANLLLHLTEAIFFFNPGIRWVATLIRQEREACCDDIVLARVPDKNSYFEALVAFKQWVIDGSYADGRSFTLPLCGDKTDLLWRIRRMLERENKKLQIMEKAILSFGLMALVTVSLISMRQKDNGQPAKESHYVPPAAETIRARVQPTAQQVARNTVHPPHDTIPGEQNSPSNGQTRTFPSFTIHTELQDGRAIRTSSATDDQRNRYELRRVDSQITEFKVNGQGVAREDYGKYADFFAAEEWQKSHPIVLQPVDPTQSVLALQQSAVGLQQSVLGLQQSVQGLQAAMPAPPTLSAMPQPAEGYYGTAHYQESVRRYEEAVSRYQEAERRYEQALLRHNEYLRMRGVDGTEEEFRNALRRYELQLRRYQEDLRRLAPAIRASLIRPVRPMAPSSPISPVTPITTEAGPARPTHPEPTLANPLVFTNHPNPVVQKIIAELIESKLIDRVDEFAISLNADGMTLNGVRQPDEVFAKYKTEYLRHANDHIIYSQYYHSDGSGSHCDVNIDMDATTAPEN